MGNKVPEALFAYLIWILIWLCWAYISCCQTLVGVLVFLNCVCACSSKWMGEDVNQDTGICMPVHVEARGQPGVSFIRHHASGTTHPVFVSSLVVWLVSLLRLGLSLACVSMIAFAGCWDTQWSPTSLCLSGMTGTPLCWDYKSLCLHTWLVCRSSRDQTQTLVLTLA